MYTVYTLGISSCDAWCQTCLRYNCKSHHLLWLRQQNSFQIICFWYDWFSHYCGGYLLIIWYEISQWCGSFKHKYHEGDILRYPGWRSLSTPYVRQFSPFFRIDIAFACKVSFSYLIGVPAAQLRGHLSNMKVTQINCRYFRKTEMYVTKKLMHGPWVILTLMISCPIHNCNSPCMFLHLLVPPFLEI